MIDNKYRKYNDNLLFEHPFEYVNSLEYNKGRF